MCTFFAKFSTQLKVKISTKNLNKGKKKVLHICIEVGYLCNTVRRTLQKNNNFINQYFFMFSSKGT